mmetsp:Transcript_2492/g.5392  ORF Transcript_2492/g.5392 Transcript_2492/m.5392 type:complete len:184 (+) Transcript_2492:136-687(+)
MHQHCLCPASPFPPIRSPSLRHAIIQIKQAGRPLVFVYGTPKRGFYNYDAYLKAAVDVDNAAFVAAGQTAAEYRLVVGGERQIPFLLANNSNIGAEDEEDGKRKQQRHHRISGEIYAIKAESVMWGLDILEGVQTGFYYRECIQVEDLDGENETMFECWVYFKKSIENHLLGLPTIPAYTSLH